MMPYKLFPINGKPPPDQPGYERVPGNPYAFRLPLVPCAHREERERRIGCCTKRFAYCTFWDDETTRTICNRCDAVKFPTEQT
jgi:hypothetical protein